MQLVMASESRFRRGQMDRLGIDYIACAHAVDERAEEPVGASPDEIARHLAVAKANSIADRFPDAHIIGSDQVVDVDGEVIGKPGTVDAALGQLARLQGREHRLVTAVALRSPDGTVECEVDVHRMRMRPLSEDERRRYVEAEKPLDSCGSYIIEGRGIAMFEAVDGIDFTAIVGLPMISVVTMLRRAGFRVL
jgi:septum formation protein